MFTISPRKKAKRPPPPETTPKLPPFIIYSGEQSPRVAPQQQHAALEEKEARPANTAATTRVEVFRPPAAAPVSPTSNERIHIGHGGKDAVYTTHAQFKKHQPPAMTLPSFEMPGAANRSPIREEPGAESRASVRGDEQAHGPDLERYLRTGQVNSTSKLYPLGRTTNTNTTNYTNTNKATKAIKANNAPDTTIKPTNATASDSSTLPPTEETKEMEDSVAGMVASRARQHVRPDFQTGKAGSRPMSSRTLRRQELPDASDGAEGRAARTDAISRGSPPPSSSPHGQTAATAAKLSGDDRALSRKGEGLWPALRDFDLGAEAGKSSHPREAGTEEGKEPTKQPIPFDSPPASKRSRAPSKPSPASSKRSSKLSANRGSRRSSSSNRDAKAASQRGDDESEEIQDQKPKRTISFLMRQNAGRYGCSTRTCTVGSVILTRLSSSHRAGFEASPAASQQRRGRTENTSKSSFLCATNHSQICRLYLFLSQSSKDVTCISLAPGPRRR